MTSRSDSGFTLVEVLVALTLIATVALVAAALSTRTARLVLTARHLTMTMAAGQQRIEQLRAVTWAVQGDGTFITDLQTDLSQADAATGGAGVAASPPGTLEADAGGYSDFLDAAGRWVGAGPVAPADGVFVRRWSVSTLFAGRTVIIRVMSMPRAGPASRSGLAGRTLAPADVAFVEIRTRTLR